MAYQRNVLGQDYSATFEPSSVETALDVPLSPSTDLTPWLTAGVPVTTEFSQPVSVYSGGWWGTDVSAIPSDVAPASTGWSWSDIWKPVADIITTGAGAFAKIYPAITGTTPQTGYPSPYPQTPNTKIPAGYTIDPVTRKLVPIGYTIDPVTGKYIPIQAGITASPYFWPVILGVGAMFLVTAGGKKGKRY